MQDLEYTEEQVMIRDMARDFARGEIAPYAQAWEKAGWIDDALVAKMGELGLLGMVVPEEWGGYLRRLRCLRPRRRRDFCR